MPVFVTPGLQIFRGNSLSGEFALPVSVLLMPGFLIYFWLKGCVRVGFEYVWVVLIALLVFLIAAKHRSVDSVMLYSLYFYPIFISYLIGNISSRFGCYISYFQYCAAVVGVFFAFLYLLASVVEFGLIGAMVNRGSDSIFGVFSVYQKFSYYSTVLSIVYVFVLFQMRGIVRVLSGAILVAAVMMTGSREAALLVCFFTLFYFGGGRGWIRLFLFLLLLLFLVSIILSVFRGELEGLTFFSKIYDLLSSGDITAGRGQAIKFIYADIEINTVFFLMGSMFSTSGYEMGTPHNQYLEWHLRGGMLFLLFNLLLIFASIIKMKRRPMYRSIFIVMIGLIIFACNINTPFRAPYTSMLIWFLLGFTMVKNPFQVLQRDK